MLLSASLIILSQWWFGQQNTMTLRSELNSVREIAGQAEQLQRELVKQKATLTDTVRILEVRTESTTVYLSLLKRIGELEAKLEKQSEYILTLSDPTEDHEGSISDGRYSQSGNTTIGNSRLHPRSIASKSVRAIPRERATDASEIQKRNSAKTVRDIKQHYRKGVGVRLGPSVANTFGFYDLGNGRLDFSFGLLTDLILSPSLSMETGINYTLRHYQISKSDIKDPRSFPGTDLSLGEVQNVDVESSVWEIPVNLKYRYPVSLKSNWLASVGYSIPIYSVQVIEHGYRFDPNQSATLSTSTRYNNLKAYPGTLNLSLGYCHEVKKNRILETSLIYHQGLGKHGVESTVPTYLGIRGVYYFKLK